MTYRSRELFNRALKAFGTPEANRNDFAGWPGELEFGVWREPHALCSLIPSAGGVWYEYIVAYTEEKALWLMLNAPAEFEAVPC